MTTALQSGPAGLGVTLRGAEAAAPPLARRGPRNWQFWAGAAIIASAALIGVLAPILAPYDPLAQATSREFEGISSAHWLGLDELGRDMFSRLVYGARITLSTAILAIAIALPVGTVIGAWAGLLRGWFDALAMRVLDVQLAYPTILLALVMIVAFEPSQKSVIAALAVGYTPYFARLVRGAVLREASMEYVLAAEALGQRRWMILARHIGPSVAGLAMVHASFAVSGAMVTEASLSFLGLGVAPSDPSWGRMLSSGAQVMYFAPHVAIIPIVALSTVIVGWFWLGEGSREWLDPRRG